MTCMLYMSINGYLEFKMSNKENEKILIIGW